MPTRVRQSGAEASAPPSTSRELPPYEAPVFSLNPAAQRALAQLSQSHNVNKLNENIVNAIEMLSKTAGDINERLAEKEIDSKKRSRVQQDEDAAQSLETLRDKVERMTQRMDAGMRKLIDGQHNVESIKTGLANVAEETRNNASTQASTQAGMQRARSQGSRRATRQAGEEGDDDDERDEEEQEEEYQDFEPTDPAAEQAVQTAPIDLFRSNMEESTKRYQSHSLRERYAENNHYRNFKRGVHEARHQDGDVRMPHESEWFGEASEPAPGVTTRRRSGNDAEEDDDDDDIAIAKSTTSTKCPLTLQEFRDPLTSKKCPHSFEKEAILEIMRKSRVGGQPGPRGNMVGGVPGVECPVPGCSQELTREDLEVDPVTVRKIRRLQRAKQLEEEGGDDDEDGEDAGVTGTQRRAQMIDDDDDEDAMNVDDLDE